MPSYAFDEHFSIVAAADAAPSKHYRCLECSRRLQKRVGRHRRAHFYHLTAEPGCRLYSKSQAHFLLQLHVQRLLPDALIERPFPNIRRIADLCSEEMKCVFEIQCSPIDPGEAKRRKADYLKEGYRLIWLLDDRLYNKRRLRVAEAEMRGQCGYYISLKKRLIYDQFDHIVDKVRVYRGPALAVDLRVPVGAAFRGDRADLQARHPDYAQQIYEQMRRFAPQTGWTRSARRYVYMLLFVLLEKLLEKLDE